MKPVTAREQERGATHLRRDGWQVAARIMALFDAAASSHRRAGLFLVLLCLAALLPGMFAIPPVDRDEARFAYVSRQMAETGDLAEVRVGLEARHTRPLGLHWIQAGIVRAAEAAGYAKAPRTIGLYRLTSLAGGIAAALLTYWAALAFTSRRAALFAATLLVSSASFGVAGRLALPDMPLVACIAAMMGALGRLYMRDEVADAGGWRLPAILWSALALALMVKGLIVPLYPALAVGALVAMDRSARVLRGSAPLAGLGLCLVVGALWFVLRHFGGSEGDPALRALTGAVRPVFDGFRALPGTYLLMFWGMFWPGAPLAALAVPIVWKARRLRAMRFLLAWVLPAWILFELLPAKVPAQLMPVFPALAILIAVAVERGALALSNTRLVRVLWLWPVIGALIAVLALLGLAVFDGTTSMLAWPLLIAGFYALVTAASFVRDYGIEKATLLAIAGMLVSGFGVVQLVLPQMQSLWISPRLAALASRTPCAEGSGERIVAAAGFSEPSLLFAMPGPVRFVDGEGAADFLDQPGCRVVFVERRQEARFGRRAEWLGLHIERGAEVAGFDPAAGRRVRLSLYRNAD
ncbi:ArnT family glycosyltransferase [Ancylobacter mangrovi]|uniref:ArnT family glycosyltransferase n=1 Tax=Ancylobacter mangrovi TaxID=2972472 RepID=UPI002162DFDA|nr:phospholipid carrier-dependent glycosyltransferase [Ancylobacter mangrovi]MCS0501864.1 phospholipid carrier-dependent glycosyltransferase [Ancylobacter mangrovi]